MSPSELTNTTEQFIGMNHISPTFMYIIPMYLRLTTFTKKTPQMSFHLYFFAIIILTKCSSCHYIVLTVVFRYEPNMHVLRVVGESGDDIQVLPENMRSAHILYKITVVTEPNVGVYEATVRHHIGNDKFSARPSEITRIDHPDQLPNCIIDNYPHLLNFCHCPILLDIN